jgi:cobalamin biosynthesis Mg chelatase CobN
MKVTLRKANALQQSILDTIKNTQLNNMVHFNEFENVTDKLAGAVDDYLDAFDLTGSLYASLYTIRKLVGKANAVEINDLLCDVALIEKKIQLNQNVATSAPATAINVIEGKIEKIKNSTDTSRSVYGRTDEVASTILDEGYIKATKVMVSRLKKEKQKIQDTVLELNIKTEIELPSGVVATLTQAGIL